MVDVMDFDFGLFDESMDLLTAPTNFMEPVELFETPVEQPVELSSEEVTAADQLLDELLNYIEPVHETPADLDADPARVMEEDKVFETLQPALDLTQEEMDAPDQLLEELFKQPEVAEPKEVLLEDFSNVTKVVTEEGKEVYILTLETKMATPEATPSKRSKKVRNSPYDKKERKRVQDVHAAQKYRKRKKEEGNMLKAEEQELVMKRNELKSQVGGMEAEVKTLKKLMVDLGLLPSSFRFHGRGVSKKKK